MTLRLTNTVEPVTDSPPLSCCPVTYRVEEREEGTVLSFKFADGSRQEIVMDLLARFTLTERLVRGKDDGKEGVIKCPHQEPKDSL